MEARVEIVEREITEMRQENREQLAELRRLLEQRGHSRPRHRRRGRSPSRERPRNSRERNDTPQRQISRHDSTHSPRRYYSRGRKIEIPVFNGEEAHGWLVRVERYFRVHHVREEDKLDAAVIALEGRALNWYQWWEEQTDDLSWEEFTRAVIRRFQPALVQNPLDPLLSTKQTGTVMEYREKFEMLIAPLKRDERVMLDSIFLNGLKEEIQAELRLHESDSLAELMDRALLIEDKNVVVQKARANPRDRGDWRDRALGWRQSKESSSSGVRNYVTRPVPSAIEGPEPKEGEEKKNMGRKSLSPEELRELSRKGLCFKCGEKWGHDHKCKLRHLQLELVESELEEREESEEEKEEVAEIGMKVLQLSMRSKEGLTSNKSFKVWGLIGNRAVVILIDNGATTNFISYELVEELNLSVTDTEEYTITMGNGEKVHHKGVCKGLKLSMQGIMVEQNFFLMTLGGTEVVLGMDWLASLGDIRANFKQLVIKWKKGTEEFMVRG